MSSENIYGGINEVLHINTEESTKCEPCDQTFNYDNFAGAMNHYMKNHGYRILHIGTETNLDGQGRIWNRTAAVLGK